MGFRGSGLLGLCRGGGRLGRSLCNLEGSGSSSGGGRDTGTSTLLMVNSLGREGWREGRRGEERREEGRERAKREERREGVSHGYSI